MKVRIPNSNGGMNQQQMLKKVQEMQENMATLQADLDAREYTGTAGGGMVSLKINGKKEILSMDIKPEIVDPDDTETLADIIIAAVNEGIKRVEETNSSEMAKVTGSIGLPGMF